MHRLTVTMPRSPYVLVLLIGATGVAMTLLTEPGFVLDQSSDGFSRGRWVALLLTVAVSVWGLKGTLVPKRLFACDRNGVRVPGGPGLIEWRHVQSVRKAAITIGLSNTSRARPVRDDAIAIRFDDEVELRRRGPRGSHGGVTGEHEYSFSVGVTGLSADDLLGRIEQLRST